MKRFLALLLSLSLALCLCACGKQEEEAQVPVDPPPAQDPVTLPGTAPETPDTPPAQDPVTSQPDPEPDPEPQPEPRAYTSRQCWEEITGEDGTLLVNIRLSIPKLDDLPQIDAAYQQIFDELVGLARNSQEDAARQLADARAKGGDFSPFYLIGDPLLMCNDGKTLSLLRKMVYSLGGEAGDQVSAETFDCATQGRLLLGDLFAVAEEDYMPRLKQLAAEAISGTGDPVLGEIDPLSFALDQHEHNLVLVTGRGQIINLPLAELADLLKPEWAAL